MTAWVLGVLPIALLLLGAPIFLILLVTGLVAIVVLTDTPLTTLHTVFFGSLDHFPLLAIPFFIFAGEVMGHGGIARRLIDWILALTGRLRGSLAYTTVGTCEFFGAMSGSSAGTVAAIGRILYPALIDKGYTQSFASGLVTSSGAIAIIIPPSIAMILYGVQAEQSVVHLFTAGIIPGLFIGVVLAIYIAFYARRFNVQRGEPMRLKRILTTTKEASWALGTPVLILGGIYGGIFTPTEAAGIACVYSVLVTRFIYRELSWRELWGVTERSVVLTAQIMIVVAAAGVYSWLLTTSGVPRAVVAVVGNLSVEPWMLLLIVTLFLLAVGCFVEPASAIIILTPLLAPVMSAAGVDLIHFGIVMTVNLSVGMYSPPFGLNIFVTQAMFNVPLTTLYRGLVPFLIVNIASLFVIIYVPDMSLFLVNLMR